MNALIQGLLRRKILVGVLTALGAIGWFGYRQITWYQFTGEASCLASIIHKDLDKFAITKGEDNLENADQQAEVIGRYKDRIAKEKKSTHCAEAIERRLAQSRWNYITGPKNETPRWQLVFAASKRILSAEYKYPLPEGCPAVMDYRATRLRPSGWIKAWRYRGIPGYSVGNMYVWCVVPPAGE